jgi:uncharacterized protein DUF1173
VSVVLIEFPGLGSYTREWLEEHGDQGQVLLAQCKGRNPICRCRSPGLPLYIAQRTKYYLARVPNSGPQHAPHCPSYEPERSECGWGIYSSAALNECGHGRVSVKLGVPLLIRGDRAGVAPMGPLQIGTERTFRDTMELPGLLHLLWERAQFNRWSPRMRNRRHYRQIYKYLLEAADSVQVRRQPLTRHLYIPEPYAPEQALEIEARRQRAFRELSQTAGGAPQRILVFGRVRSIVELTEGLGIRLAHLPNEFILCMSRERLARLRVATEFAWLDHCSLHPEFQLLVLLTMQRTCHGKWQVDELAGMVTTDEFIPSFSMEDAIVAKRLIHEERTFYKPLPYDAASTRFPNFLLTDCGESAVPLEIVGSSASDAAARRQRIAEYEEAKRRYWLWDVGAAALPPTLLEPAAGRRQADAQPVTACTSQVGGA